MADRGTCRDCSAPILWVTMRNSGKKNPLDATPVEDGNILIGDGKARCDACGCAMRARGTQSGAPLLCAGCQCEARERSRTGFRPKEPRPDPWELT